MSSNILSSDDCKLIVRKFLAHNDFAISKFSINQFSSQTLGFMCEHFLLTVSAKTEKGNVTLTFFVKIPGDGTLSTCFGDADYCKKELFVYNFCTRAKDVLPQMDIGFLPKLIHHKSDGTLVLENLLLKGYSVPQCSRFNKDHMYRALEALAKFHALSIAYEELYGKIDNKEQLEFYMFKKDEQSAASKFARSSEIGACKLAELVFENKDETIDFKKYYSKSLQEIYRIFNEDKNKFRNVLCHGDLWINNALFKYKNGVPVSCKWVDYQLVSYSPPAFDVTALVYCGSAGEGYKDSVHDYYEHYYKTLREELKEANLDVDKILPVHEFHQTCQIYMKCTMIIWLSWRQVTQAKHNFCKLGQDHRLYQDVVLGDKRAWFVEDNFKDAVYRDFLVQRVHELKRFTRNGYITIEDCYKIVQKTIGSTSYSIQDFYTKKFEERGGFLGEHNDFYIQLEDKCLKYFLKLSPQTESPKQFAEATGVCYKETRFYSKIVPEFKQQGITTILDILPKCYIAYIDVLVFEHLVDQGYKIRDKRMSLDLETFKLGIKAISKLHVSGIVFEERMGKKLCDLYPVEFKESIYGDCDMSMKLIYAAKNGIAEQINLLSGHTTNITPTQFAALARQLFDKYSELVTSSDKFRNTICHGDLWTNNIMINDAKKHALLVDFQCYRYCPPAADLMQYLYLSTDKDFRWHHEKEVVDFYYAEFKRNLEAQNIPVESVFTYEEFLKSCEHERPFAIAQTVTHFNDILLTPEEMDSLLADEDFMCRSFYEDRSEFLRRMLPADPVYRRRNEEALEDLRDLCEHYARHQKWERI